VVFQIGGGKNRALTRYPGLTAPERMARAAEK